MTTVEYIRKLYDDYRPLIQRLIWQVKNFNQKKFTEKKRFILQEDKITCSVQRGVFFNKYLLLLNNALSISKLKYIYIYIYIHTGFQLFHGYKYSLINKPQDVSQI